MSRIQVPTSWDEVTIRQFRELAGIDKDASNTKKIIETISILCDIDPEEVKRMPITVINDVTRSLDFMNEVPLTTFDKEFEVDGKVYKMTEPSKMSVGEWVDIEEYIKDINSNMHKILAILYRDGEYDGYNAERCEIMDSQPVSRIYGAMVFFSAFAAELYRITKGYSQEDLHKATIATMKMQQLSGDGTELSIDSLGEILQSLGKLSK